MAFWNNSKTVWERLFLHLSYIILEKPSIQPYTTSPQRIREWYSSRCHSELGQGTRYYRRKTTIPHLKAVFSGSSPARLSRTLHLCTLTPVISNGLPSISAQFFDRVDSTNVSLFNPTLYPLVHWTGSFRTIHILELYDKLSIDKPNKRAIFSHENPTASCC